MGFVKTSATAVGRLLVVLSLAITFMVGMMGVFYLSLVGDEIKIPKIVGKNFNIGEDELSAHGLRIKKIATRYSEEEPNTILEQRPRAGTTAKSGLMISVVVSKENPDTTEAPADIKEEEDDIKEIEDLPELKTEKPKKKKKKKSNLKTRDVIEDKAETEAQNAKSSDKDAVKDSKAGGEKSSAGATEKKVGGEKAKPPKNIKPKQKANDKKPTNIKKPKPATGTRSRRVTKSN